MVDFSSWLNTDGKPAIIAGPCSAETEEQVMATATALKASNRIHAYRAGVWKPRTRPNSFEGVGEKAFPWLQRVQNELGIPVAVEVANAKHVELALEYGMKILWIGARTTVNPFSVQEIADVLKGVDIPVMVKNPINPDLALWIGALERINQAGIKQIAAIHRGFSSMNKQFRNAPNWEIPIELKTTLPSLPLFCDPSHIAGTRDKLSYIAQKAFDLDFDGLMIESHHTPDVALREAKQQITPIRLDEMMGQLIVRNVKSNSAEFTAKLETYRSAMDELDSELIRVLAKRFDLSKELGEYKKENNVAVFQLERWKEILESRIPFAQSQDIDAHFTEILMKIIHDESIRIQTEIFQQETQD
jgi:chorismate mutase